MILLALCHLFLLRIRYVIRIATLCSISTTSSYTAFFFFLNASLVSMFCHILSERLISTPLLAKWSV